MIERLNRKIRRRTRVVDGFPNSNIALMPINMRTYPPHRRKRAVDPPLSRYVPLDDNSQETNRSSYHKRTQFKVRNFSGISIT
ncbi:transposase [Bifidobacterium dentium]|nr:transposase [Bifidobacterium dentium]